MSNLNAEKLLELSAQATTLDPEEFGRIAEVRLGLQLYWRPPFDDAQFIYQLCLEPTRDHNRADCVFSAFGNLVQVQIPLKFESVEKQFREILAASGWTVVPDEMMEWRIFPNPDWRVHDAFFGYS
ncbi:MAG: hypothetical protein ACAI34_16765 [Verrucomicrobium sp.]